MNRSSDSQRPVGGDPLPPVSEPGAAQPEDPRLVEAAQEYLRALEQGHKPDRLPWQARYPDLADALNACFDGIDIMHGAAASLHTDARRDLPVDSDPGDALPLGDFRIVREIGRGGMGIVYEAIQLSLGRHVALKVLPFATSLDTRSLQRFRQEAQAAAQLHHTNIVPVFAVGCERGTHFYAMQLIEGRSLDILIAQLRRAAGREGAEPGPSLSAAGTQRWTVPIDFPATVPLNRGSGSPTDVSRVAVRNDHDETLTKLSADISTQREGGPVEYFRFVAGLMAQAAEALEYAHKQGVIHRDIKPGNLLIDVRHELWITDFGLAQFHDQQGLTQTGDLVGTIRYASPEQIAGQRVVLDHRTDIYSLGATFYELLTLRPIFAGPTREALLHQVVNQEPVAPRSLDRTIPVELETILLKAVSKNPPDRYGSAQALADDLRRFLRYEPIQATRPTLVDRFRKWMRRHPSMVVAAVVVMFVTLIVSGISNWLITQANIRTQDALHKEQLRAQEVEKGFVQARNAVDLLIDVSETELADKPPLSGLRKRLLETALVYYEDFIAQHRGNSSSQSELTRVRERVRKILDELTVMEGVGELMLAGEVDVQTDLQLSQAQRAEIEAIITQCAEDRRNLLLDDEHSIAQSRRAAFLQRTREAERALRGALSSEQLARLEQIVLQIQGPEAFHRSDVVAALGLTQEQQRTIRQIELDQMMTLWDRPLGGPPGDRDAGPGPGPPPGGPDSFGGPEDFGDLDAFGGPDAFGRPDAFGPMPGPGGPGKHARPIGGRGPFGPEITENILAVLTAEQRAKWEQRIGPRFSGRARPPHLDFALPPRAEPAAPTESKRDVLPSPHE